MCLFGLAAAWPACTKNAMERRVLHFVLVFAGTAPAVWAICIASDDPGRAAALGVLAALGLALNIAGLAKSDFGVRVPLRVMVCGVALALLAYVLGMWQWFRGTYLPELPPTEAERREVVELTTQNLLWIAGSVLYVVISVLILPKPPPLVEPPLKERKRIDFRTFGR